jgi:acetyltransferase-like isoleucine patch superfamily enzyme
MRLKNIVNIFLSPINRAKKIGVTLGENCIIAKSVDFGSEPYMINIGDNFYSSDNIKFITHDGSVNVIRNLYKEYKNADLIHRIKIGNNVFLGVDVVVLPGTIIGNNVIVGAKSVVKGELKSNSVYAGIPAKYICSIDNYIERNLDKFIYTKSYSLSEKKIFLLQNIK